ncbi:MAG: small subunit ribosomal protein [Chloroflexota bacterium]|jgi:small subunit ribosomal protein S20|nr:small subunit ribosomal protein [Chloroflexota bacterium]
MAKRTASAKKQARSGVRRAQRNRAVRSEVKTKVVKARRTLTGGPVAESDRFALALEAIQALDRAASKGVLHRNNAGRRKSRLAKQLSKLAVAPAAGSASGKGKKAPAASASKPAAKAGASKAGAAKSAAPSGSTKKK